MKFIVSFLILPALAFPGYFLSFGTDIGLRVGYSESWFSIWAGYPYSGFEATQEWSGYFLKEEISSRLFDSNVPGFGKIEAGLTMKDVEGYVFTGFTTNQATTVGDSELMGGMFFGIGLKYGNDVYAFVNFSSTFFGLYRKAERFYFGFAPVNEYSLFPYSIDFGVGKIVKNFNLTMGYSLRSGAISGIPTPVVDVGGLFVRFRVER